jgi:Amt family ammonium transporter
MFGSLESGSHSGNDASACIDGADTAWLLLSFVLVLSMFAGLALFEASLLQAKNTVSVLVQVLVGLISLSVLWDLVGFTLVYGPTQGGIIGGLNHAFLIDVPYDTCSKFAPTVPAAAFAMFQMLFAAISPLLMTGAFAERLRFWPSLVLMVGWEMLVYYPIAHWVWGGGWLSTHFGVKDFAGGIVIHTTAGAGSLVCAVILGPRHGFKAAGNDDPAPPSSLPTALLGCGLLFTGWFGFNAGSALSSGVVSTSAVVSTQIGGCVSGLVWMVLSSASGNSHEGEDRRITEAGRRRQGPSLMALMNGTIAGLAGITPASGFIDSQASLCLGALIGLCTYCSVGVLKHRCGIDDALDVSSVHGVSGIVGSIGVGFLASPAADPTLANAHQHGLFYGGGLYLLRAQLLGVTVAFVWSTMMTGLILFITEHALRGCTSSIDANDNNSGAGTSHRRLLLRVSAEDELLGLDVAEYGQVGVTSMTEEERARADLHLQTTGAPFKRTPSYERILKRVNSSDAILETLHEHTASSGKIAVAGDTVVGPPMMGAAGLNVSADTKGTRAGGPVVRSLLGARARVSGTSVGTGVRVAGGTLGEQLLGCDSSVSTQSPQGAIQ